MPDRVVVFIDAQNVYQRARAAFFARESPHTAGQINPLQLGHYLTSQTAPDSHPRTLHQVRVYTGRPDATKDPKSYAAHLKQCQAWDSAGIVVIPRPLQYPPGWPAERAREKGIDVMLAIDFVAMAVHDQYEVGIMFSVDTDLTPALEFVAGLSSSPKVVEVAAWRSPTMRGRLSVKSGKIWCHWLDRSVYNRVADPTDYNV